MPKQTLQLDKYARDAKTWWIYAQVNYDGARVLFTHEERNLTLCFVTSTAAALAQTLNKFDRRRTQKQESDSCIYIHGDAMIFRVVKRPKRRRH
jgi:hypothetical protein